MTKVLIVEPDEVRRSQLAFQLSAARYEVHVAVDGVAALDMLQETRYDTVIAAQSMPGLTGSDLIEHVRSKFHYFYLPFVLLADHQSAPEMHHRLAEDMSVILETPVRVVALLAALDAAMLRIPHRKRLMHQ